MMNLIHLSFQAFLLHAVGLLGRGANAYDDSDGKWGDLFQMTVIPIHAMILPDGKVLSYGADTGGTQGGGSYYEIWDVEANNHVAGANHVRLAHNTGVNTFCSTLNLDPSTGNVIIMGGDGRPKGNYNNGVKDALELNAKTYAVRNHPKGDMNYERWYGTSINLPDGRIFVAGGESDQNHVASSIPEVWSPQDGFKALPGADIPALKLPNQLNWWYPHVYVNSQGRIIIIMAFSDKSSRDVYLVGNIDGRGSIEKVGTKPFGSDKLGPSILYDVDLVVMLDDDGVLWSVDISNPTNPVFTRRLDIGPARTNAAMSMLPDGRVIITGGCTHSNKQGNRVDCAVRNVQIWDPKRNRVYTGPNQQLPRLYHSSGLILPDGSVFSAGGGAPGPLKNHNGQVYYPGYMFAASRPQITAWPENIKAGDSFVIKVKSSAIVKKVTATKPGSMTHARNCDARWINLGFDVMDGTSITVHTPGRNILIPGLWNLNVLDGDDVPSPSRLFGVNMAALPGGGSGGGGGSGVVPPPPPSASPVSTKAPSPTVTVGGGSGSPQQNLGTYAMLKENERLYANELVKSATPGFELRLETSGLLALYRSSAPGKIIWRAELESTGIAGRAQVQGDGHFILRATDGRPLWRTKKTGDQGKYFLTILPEGTDPKIAVVRGTPDQPGSILWSEPIDLQGSSAVPAPVPGPSSTPESPVPASGGGSGTEPKTIRLQTPVKACSGVPGGCGQCEGHCRDNSDCASGLVCYPKARGEPVPFCDGIDNSRTKWCTYPNSGGSSGPPPSPTPAPPSPPPPSSPVVKTKIPLQTPVRECRPGSKCGQCEGHCRSNSDCATGLICYKKASGQAVPWCDKIDYSRTAWCTYA